MYKTLKILTITLLATGCSGYAGTWPNLNDPLPNPDERKRIHIISDVKISPFEEIDSKSISFTEHQNLTASVNLRIQDAWLAFDKIRSSIEAQGDAEDKLIAWTGSQLALSRVSDEVNELRGLFTKPISNANAETVLYQRSLEERLSQLDKQLSAAKEVLAAQKP